MDFIVDNYFLFIVGGIVILMIIIGFIAEKTDFGRKPFGQKKVDNKDNNEKEELVEESTDSEIAIPETENSDEFMIPEGFTDAELPEAEMAVSESIEENNVAETIEENIIEEPMADLEVPEINEEEKLDTPEVSDVVEDVVDDSEDDVWKF